MVVNPADSLADNAVINVYVRLGLHEGANHERRKEHGSWRIVSSKSRKWAILVHVRKDSLVTNLKVLYGFVSGCYWKRSGGIEVSDDV